MISAEDRALFMAIAADQRPHPMEGHECRNNGDLARRFTWEELASLGVEDAIAAVGRRATELQRAADDPYHHGWFYRAWDDCLWELVRLRVATPGIPVAYGIAGSNGAGKSQMVAAWYTTAMEQCDPSMPAHQRTFWTFADDDKKSAEVVEAAIRFWQPNDYKTNTGRVKTMDAQKMGYNAEGGFTNDGFAIPSGAVCRHKFWSQDIGKLEGPRPCTAWGDEAVPEPVLESCMNRLLSAAEWTHEMLPQWEELLAAKAANSALWFPREFIGRLLVGVLLVTYTFKDGYTPTVGWFDRDATTMGEVEADPELLPRRSKEGEIIGGERLPCLRYGKKHPERRLIWIYAWQNPLGGNWAGMKATESKSVRSKILWKCYGIAEHSAETPFPNFSRAIHARPISWLPPYDAGTWWMSVDPNASGGRNWVHLWAFVLGRTHGHLNAGDIFIAHEYPQRSDTILAPGLVCTGDDCLWATPGGKTGLGVKGPAQKPWPVGYAFRASEIRRIEAKLAQWQGLTELQGTQENSMLDLYGRRIADSRSSNTALAGQEQSKTIIEWMADNEIYFMRAGADAGGEPGSGMVLPGEQNINSTLWWDTDLAELDPKTGWKEISPHKGRGPKVRIADHCTNLLDALQYYAGANVPGARKSPFADFIDALRYLLNANPCYVDLESSGSQDNSHLFNSNHE